MRYRAPISNRPPAMAARGCQLRSRLAQRVPILPRGKISGSEVSEIPLIRLHPPRPAGWDSAAPSASPAPARLARGRTFRACWLPYRGATSSLLPLHSLAPAWLAEDRHAQSLRAPPFQGDSGRRWQQKSRRDVAVHALDGVGG